MFNLFDLSLIIRTRPLRKNSKSFLKLFLNIAMPIAQAVTRSVKAESELLSLKKRVRKKHGKMECKDETPLATNRNFSFVLSFWFAPLIRHATFCPCNDDVGKRH